MGWIVTLVDSDDEFMQVFQDRVDEITLYTRRSLPANAGFSVEVAESTQWRQCYQHSSVLPSFRPSVANRVRRHRHEMRESWFSSSRRNSGNEDASMILDVLHYAYIFISFPIPLAVSFSRCLSITISYTQPFSLLHHLSKLHITMPHFVESIESAKKPSMKPSIDLNAFGVTRNAFLPAESPLELLSDSYYEPWEHIVKHLPELIDNGSIRDVVAQLPVLETSRLISEAEWQRAYVMLGFMAQAYIWGGDKPAEVGSRLPRTLCAHPLMLTTNATGSATANNGPVPPCLGPL